MKDCSLIFTEENLHVELALLDNCTWNFSLTNVSEDNFLGNHEVEILSKKAVIFDENKNLKNRPCSRKLS
jgi:hypothetical protein